MRLFYLINSWAGQNVWVDNFFRVIYVSAVPLLFTALAALLILVPRPKNSLTTRRHIAGAAITAVLICALFIPLTQFFQQQVLDGAPLSSRPFMTHWARTLIAEPNDNSFPSFEVMFAAAAATLIWASLPSAGLVAGCVVLLLAFARVFCGTNFVADSMVGALLGLSLGALSLALWRVPLKVSQFPRNTGTSTFQRYVGSQAFLSLVVLCGLAVFSVQAFNRSPALSAKWQKFRAHPVSTARADSGSPAPIAQNDGKTQALSHEKALAAPNEYLLASRAARLDGHLPESEQFLTEALQTLQLPHRLIGVNVAQVYAGTSAYRCAAIRFEVAGKGSEERKRVAETAAQYVKRAFHVDAQLRHVDILGMQVRRDAQNNVSERPVFTAAISRDRLILREGPAWMNWSGLDGGAWLRARSQIYIDSTLLPEPTAVSGVSPSEKPAP